MVCCFLIAKLGYNDAKRDIVMPTKPTAKSPKVTASKITDYQPDPSNPNTHSERGVQMLGDSLSVVGLGRSIVVDKNGIVLAGNSTQERAVDQGFENAIEIESDGSQLIVVKRTDLDLSNDPEQRARKLTFYDNRTAELGIQWDIDQLEASMDEGVDLSRMFTEGELKHLLSLQTAEAYEDELSGKTPDERLDVFLNATIKQVVLMFTNEQFDAVIPRLAAARQREGVETNTELFLKMLEQYENLIRAEN